MGSRNSRKSTACYFLLNFVRSRIPPPNHLDYLLSLAIFFWILSPRKSPLTRRRWGWTCYFLLNFVRGRDPCPRPRLKLKILLFSFEFCSCFSTHYQSKRFAVRACYFLLNFVCRCDGRGLCGRDCLAIFFWILFASSVLPVPAGPLNRTCYFLLNFVSFPFPSLLECFYGLLLFSFEFCFKESSLPFSVHDIVLLFSFEFCEHPRIARGYLTWSAQLAIFFWILSNILRRPRLDGHVKLAIFFWILCCGFCFVFLLDLVFRIVFLPIYLFSSSWASWCL